MLYKVEFIDGENYARFNGELSTPEWWENKCGLDGEIDIDENYILYKNVLYLRTNKSVYAILEAVGVYYPKAPKYDFAFNKGYGSEQYMTTRAILGEQDAFVVRNPEWLQKIEVRTYATFRKDHPRFNLLEYKKLMNSLEVYYEGKK